jgi:hypothetical protein
MPLYLQNGKLIQKAGALGTSSGCCCVQKTKVCECSDPYGYAPLTVTAQVTLGVLLSGSTGSCANTDAEAQVNGTYVLEYIGPDGFGTIFYRLTLANGMTVEYRIRCAVDGFSIGAEFVIRFCDLSTACFQRVSIYANNSTTLCGVAYGSTSTISYIAAALGCYFDNELYNPFGGAVNCVSTPTYRAYFACNSSVTFQW